MFNIKYPSQAGELGGYLDKINITCFQYYTNLIMFLELIREEGFWN